MERPRNKFLGNYIYYHVNASHFPIIITVISKGYKYYAQNTLIEYVYYLLTDTVTKIVKRRNIFAAILLTSYVLNEDLKC